MPAALLVAIIVALGVGIGVATSRKRPPPEVTAAVAQMFARYCVDGPSGEHVFKPDIAANILRSLAAQLYTHPNVADAGHVQVHIDPSGAPPSANLSALGWAREQNKTQSIMAPVYMAEASAADRFLQATPPGKERFDGGNLYAVLAYPGVLERGESPPGRPPEPGALPVAPPPVSPMQAAQAQIPPDLLSTYKELLIKGNDVGEMQRVASVLDSNGLHDAAEQLRKRAADLQIVAVPGPPLPSVPGPVPRPMPAPMPVPSRPPPGAPPGWVVSVATAQRALLSLGYLTSPTQVDGNLGPVTLGAVKMFQRMAGLVVDGVVGPRTAAALASPNAPPAPHQMVSPAAYAPTAPAPFVNTTALAPRSTHTVASIQSLLASLGYAVGPIDGAWGPLTLAAVRSFQAQNSLTVDGIVGPNTWAALNAPSALGPAQSVAV